MTRRSGRPTRYDRGVNSQVVEGLAGLLVAVSTILVLVVLVVVALAVVTLARPRSRMRIG